MYIEGREESDLSKLTEEEINQIKAKKYYKKFLIKNLSEKSPYIIYMRIVKSEERNRFSYFVVTIQSWPLVQKVM